MKDHLEGLVNGHTPPDEAAEDFNPITTSIAERKHAEWIRRPDECKYKITPDEQARGWKDTDMCHFAPDLRRGIRVVFGRLLVCVRRIRRIMMDRVGWWSFVKVLKELPRHAVYAFTGISSGDLNDTCPNMALWPIEAGWEGIYTYFEDEVSAWSAYYRLRELNSAMARLTSSNMIDCSGLSAIYQFLPDSSEYPGLE